MKSNRDSNELTKNSFSKHAPKVWTLLSEALSKEPESAATGVNISNLFEALATAGLLEHPGIKREVGVSFNPRPARHLEIILREFANSNSEIWLATLMAIWLEPNQPTPQPNLPLQSAQDRAQKILKFESQPTSQGMDAASSIILLTRTLDNLRHAHMSDPTVLSLDQTLLIADALLVECKNSPALSRLYILVQTAADRIKNRVRR